MPWDVIDYCRRLSYFFRVPGLEPDDLYQEAMVAAWLAPGHERTAARRQVIDLLRFAKRQKRPVFVALDNSRHAQSHDVVERVEQRERLRAIVDADLTENEQIALGRSARGEPIRRHEKALDVAYWRARRRLQYSES